MEPSISIAEFIKIIRRLPIDPPRDDLNTWYRTQKEHWLGWLGEYGGPGAYGRKGGDNRDARFAYNHIVCPELLLYLIRAIPLGREQIEAAEGADQSGATLMERCGLIRKAVPWTEIYQAVWGTGKPTSAQRLRMYSTRYTRRYAHFSNGA